MSRLEIAVNVNGQPREATQYANNEDEKTQHTKQNKSDEQYSRMMKAAAIGVGKKAISTGLSRVGAYSGKQGLQNDINNAVKLVGYGTALAMGVLSGPVFAVIAAGYVAFDIGINYWDTQNERVREEQNRQYLRDFSLQINHNRRQQGNE